MNNKKKKNNKKIYPIAIVVIVAVIISGVVICSVAESNKMQKLKEEYIALLDESMAEVYEDEDCIEYQLSDMSYSITNIEKAGDGTYMVDVVIDCKTNDPELDSLSASFIAYAVKEYVPGGLFEEVQASTGDWITVYNDNHKDKYFGEDMVTINVNGKLVRGPEAHDFSNSSYKDTVTCKSCGRKFQKGSGAASSISRTNMCTNCYNNFKKASDALKEMPVD